MLIPGIVAVTDVIIMIKDLDRIIETDRITYVDEALFSAFLTVEDRYKDLLAADGFAQANKITNGYGSPALNNSIGELIISVLDGFLDEENCISKQSTIATFTAFANHVEGRRYFKSWQFEHLMNPKFNNLLSDYGLASVRMSKMPEDMLKDEYDKGVRAGVVYARSEWGIKDGSPKPERKKREKKDRPIVVKHEGYQHGKEAPTVRSTVKHVSVMPSDQTSDIKHEPNGLYIQLGLDILSKQGEKLQPSEAVNYLIKRYLDDPLPHSFTVLLSSQEGKSFLTNNNGAIITTRVMDRVGKSYQAVMDYYKKKG